MLRFVVFAVSRCGLAGSARVPGSVNSERYLVRDQDRQRWRTMFRTKYLGGREFLVYIEIREIKRV